MGISVARLRVGLVVGAVLLTLVVAGFLGYARYRSRHFLAALPGKLGIDIRRETNGYTYSQSVGGKTVMTLHASKAVEHMDGKLTLHDVSMVLYGRKQDRNDRISGSEFEYEQATGVVRAVGEVHIDLQAPAHALPAAPGAPQPREDAEDDSRMIHVKTSGLVYIQKLGVAATDQGLEFHIGGMTGQAVGAEYNSDTGILILQSEVKANGLQRGTPVVLTASHAELDRPAQRALFIDAKYVSPRQSVRGDHATVHLRSDGSPERVEAEGNVVLASPGTGEASGSRADLMLDAAGRAESARLWGGVRYADRSSLREANGMAQDGHVAFDAAGQPQTVLLTGAVRVSERSRPEVTAAWTTREAVGEKMTLYLTGGGAGAPATLHAVEAVGAAHTVMVDEAGARSELGADVLQGRFSGEGKGLQLTSMHGEGHTLLVRHTRKGETQTSSGDVLDVAMRPGTDRRNDQNIVKATQTGHVALTSTPAAKLGLKTQPAPSRAVAELAVYDGDSDRLTLTGGAQVVEESGTVSANRIVVERSTGDAKADGNVRATYRQTGAAEPVHVLGDRAELEHDAGCAIFYGTARPARLWQGGSQVEAPVLEFEQAKRRLLAHDAAGGHVVSPVHAVLVGAGGGKQTAPSVVRIASAAMVYDDAARRVNFTDDIKVEGPDGILRAHQAAAFLKPAAASGTVAGTSKVQPDMSFNGSVERIVASGKVELDQPGRRAAGEQLVYTAADRLFVLTGTPETSPRLVDEAQGTVVGREIRFHAGDQSVAVIGGDAANPAARVHSVVRTRQR